MFEDYALLTQHYEEIHLNITKVTWELCGKSYNSKPSLLFHKKYDHAIDLQKCMIWSKVFPTKLKAMYHIKIWHTDLYIKFDKTTEGMLEPLDILSVPEDILSSQLSGRNTAKILKHIQDLRSEAQFETKKNEA